MTTNQIILLSVIYLLVLNLIAMVFFALDKRAARRGLYRMPESTLLMIAFIGGSLGCLIAQRLLRHKTRKQPFKFHLYFIVFIQIAFFLAICLPEVRQSIYKQLQ